MLVVLSFIITLTCCQNTVMLVYDQPGNFILTPEDYQYADSFIVEMWSGGASSDEYLVDCSSIQGGIGGGSGAYLKAFINTHQMNFNMSVGAGVAYCQSNIPYGSDGINTHIINDKINFTLSGGYTNGTGGKVISKVNHDISNQIYAYYNGQIGLTSSINSQTIGASCNYEGSKYGNGGSTPFGGIGGKNNDVYSQDIQYNYN